jgi:glycopeptide antibiotics resistance protein
MKDLDEIAGPPAWHWSTWARWGAWLLVIVALTVLPLSDFRGHAHWDKVTWVPFRGPHVKPVDVLLNIGLFVPFGAWWPPRHLGRSHRHLMLVLASAALLSCLVEFWQVFGHNRFPSATDVVSNVMGAALGVRIAQASWASRARRMASRSFGTSTGELA